MTIINKIANEIFSRINCELPESEDAAQAAWDVVKAEMLGDDVVYTVRVEVARASYDIYHLSNANTRKALTAAMKKMEE